MLLGLELLQSKTPFSIDICYIVLTKVREKLKDISSSVSLSDMELLDISSLISFEAIQVDRQLI